MKGLTQGTMPDITPPQLVALVIAGIPIIAQLLHAFGLYDVSPEAQQALSNALTWAGVLAGSLIGGDALLRTGRNLRKGAVEAALVSDPAVTPENVTVRNSVLQTGTTFQSTPSSSAPINPATKLPSRTQGFEEPT
jgi:hypothetical protein